MAICVLSRPLIARARQRVLLVLSASALACAALASIPSSARADVQIGGDLDYVLPLESRAEMGAGFAIRLGWQLHLPLLVITPEAAFNYAGFSDTYGPAVYRTVAGLRVGVGEVFRLGAFAHGGLGHLSASVPGPDPTRTGFTYDLGIFFAFTLLPLLNLGVHAAYDQIPGTDDPSFQWLTFGAHAELIL
jgi:hypothetical protein